MNRISIKDNSESYVQDNFKGDNIDQAISDLEYIASCRLNGENNDIWVFPDKDNRYDDKLDKEANIISLSEVKDGDGVKHKVTTGNIMGFVGYNSTQLTIRSRFSSGSDDWFMQDSVPKSVSG